VLAIWFGLLTGLAELGGLAIRKFALHQILYVSPHVVWMAPLVDEGVWFLIGLGVALAAWYRPGLVSLRAALFLYALPAWWTLLLMIPRCHRGAALLLAAGLAAQTARFLAARPEGLFRAVRLTLGWGRLFQKPERRTGERRSEPSTPPLLSRREVLVSSGAALAGLATGVYGWHELARRRGPAPMPRGGPNQPNVLLIVLDTVRARSTSLHGYHRPTTPRLERLAERGVRFDRALATAPWTTASHASMFTGRFPHELSVGWSTPLDGTYPTLAEVLGQQGYQTAGFVANLGFCGYETGLQRGFAHYADYRITAGELLQSASLVRDLFKRPRVRDWLGYYDLLNRKNAAEVNEQILGWLDAQERRPFFVFLNYFDAHIPYLPPARFRTMFGPELPRRNPFMVPQNDWSPAEVQAELDAYEAAIACLDQHVGALLDQFEQRGQLQNTLVIVTADHGEEFGEHGLFEHGNSLYLPALHVPLVISFPGRTPAGLRVASPVSLRDLPATVVHLLGLATESPFPGQSLARCWHARGTAAPADEPLLSEVSFTPNKPAWVPVARGDMKSLVLGGYHYIRCGDGGEELYDLHSDPLEQRDLAHSVRHRRIVERCRAALAVLLT
jgi:arylsulfatase A-like enzyme